MLEFFSIGFTLVVSPLVSLIEDQVMALKKINIPAEMLNASVEKSEVTRILNDMTNPKSEIRLLYVTPEKLAKSKRYYTSIESSNPKLSCNVCFVASADD